MEYRNGLAEISGICQVSKACLDRFPPAGAIMMATNDYQVHMLRIWREAAENEGSGSFRASLENTKTAVRIGFSDLDTLMEYLRQQANEPAKP